MGFIRKVPLRAALGGAPVLCCHGFRSGGVNMWHTDRASRDYVIETELQKVLVIFVDTGEDAKLCAFRDEFVQFLDFKAEQRYI